MGNAGLDEVQAEIEIAGRNVNNLRYVDDTTFMAESKEELTDLLMNMKEESEKAGLKLNIHARESQESSLAPQFEGINFSVLRFFYCPALTYIHN